MAIIKRTLYNIPEKPNFTVNVTIGQNDAATIDKTYEEILAAYNNGNLIIFNIQDWGSQVIPTYFSEQHMFCAIAYVPNQDHIIQTSSTLYVQDFITVTIIVGTSNGETAAVAALGNSKFLPYVDTDDNDKTLKVVNGSWKLVSDK